MKEFNDVNVKKRSLKGMTLIEIIIAMVVLVIISTMMAVAAVGVVNNLRTSKSVVEKVNYQSKFIYDKTSNSYNKYNPDDGSTVNTPYLSNSMNISLASDPDGSTGIGSDIPVVMYEAPEDDNAIYKNYDRAGNLKFFVHNADSED